MNVHQAFQASASSGTMSFQVEHVTYNTRVSIEPNGHCYMNFSCSCRITESKILFKSFKDYVCNERC